MAQYQEGQYVSQFMNTLPQQLLAHSQFQEGQRQFDALQGLRESAEERALAAEARMAEQYEYGKEQRSLLSMLMQKDREINLERSEAISRKNKALENMKWHEKFYTAMPWTETENEWAQRVTGYDPWDERWKPLGVPEGLDLDPSLYQYLNQLSGYKDPRTTLMNLTMGGAR